MIKTTGLNLKKEILEISHLDLHIHDGESYSLLASGDRAQDHLVNIFLGLEEDYQGNVLVNDIDIRSSQNSYTEHLVYLSSGNQWPQDLKFSHLLSFFKEKLALDKNVFEEFLIRSNIENLGHKKISNFDESEIRQILFSMARLKKNMNFIFKDFMKGMPPDITLEFKKGIEELKEGGSSILYLGDDVFLAPEISDRIGFMKKGKLRLELTGTKMRKMDLKELYFKFLAERLND